MNDLERRWPELLARHPEIRDRLLGAYREPHRAYHGQRHLAEVLDRIELLLDALDEAGEPLPDPDTVVLAAWFHDAVYEGARDDEERSATLAERELSSVDVPPATVADVARLVRATADHLVAPDDRAGQVLCDADLGILAAGDARYAEYARGVRAEYAHLSEGEFRDGRARVLRRLLSGGPLFLTEYAREHWEERARANIERELAGLERPGEDARAPAR